MNQGVAKELIYSFHLPLFFFVGGYLYKPKPVSQSLKSDFKRLIIPYIITSIVLLCFYYALGYLHKDYSKAYTKTIAVLFGCGAEGIPSKYFSNIPTSPPIWFLLALFWCKNFYNLLPRYKMLLSVIIGVLAIYIHYYIVNFPWCFLLGCSAMIFYSVGNYCRNNKAFEHFNWVIAGISFVGWLFVGLHYGLYMYMARWDNIVLNTIGAIGAIYLCFHLSKWIKVYVLQWLGRNSLTILCVHTFFFVTKLMFRYTNNLLLLILNDIIVSLFLLICFSSIKLRKRYTVEQND